MKLSTPSDVEEAEEPGEQPSGDRGDVTEPGDVMVQTTEGEMPLPEVVQQNTEMLDRPGGAELATSGEVRNVGEELAATRRMVEEQREMIAELVEVVEMLTIAVDSDELKRAKEVWADHGGDGAPVEWDGDAYGLKQERYE